MTTRNELQSNDDEFFKQPGDAEFFRKKREDEVWQTLSTSEELPWSEDFIEKYIDKWDWAELSNNRCIEWTPEMLEKFKDRIIWNLLSESIVSYRFNCVRKIPWDTIKKFETRWNWRILSKNGSQITPEIIDQFIDKWDWYELVDNAEIKWDYRLFERYKKNIPISNFHQFSHTYLWSCLVQIDKRIIIGSILAESYVDSKKTTLKY